METFSFYSRTGDSLRDWLFVALLHILLGCPKTSCVFLYANEYDRLVVPVAMALRLVF